MYLHVHFVSFEVTPVTALVNDLGACPQQSNACNLANFILLSSKQVN